MARSKRFLILLAVLAAACAAAAIALNWQQRQEQIQTSGEAVLEIDPDSVQALSWTRGELSLSFTRDEEGNWSYDDDDARWTRRPWNSCSPPSPPFPQPL